MPGLVTLRNGGCRATVSQEGGAVLEAEVDGIPLLMPSKSPGLATRVHGREACFPLLPFGGRIERNGFRYRGENHVLTPNTADPLVLHGDGWLREWTVASVSSGHADLALDVEANDRSPYAYSAEQRIELLPDGLKLTLSVANRGPVTLPFGIGFHPYLPVSPETEVQFEAGGVWSERDMHLPGAILSLGGELDFSGFRPVPDCWINNCYEDWQGRAMIRTPRKPVLTLTADPLFRWLMVYKPQGQPNFLCLEPMSHLPNGHYAPGDAGLRALDTGMKLCGSVTVRIQR